MKSLVLTCLSLLCALPAFAAPELVIGEKRVEPGIMFVFEGAIKDDVAPHAMHLKEQDTDVHLEARVNWDTISNKAKTPRGAVPGGFVPYLHITAKVVNRATGKLAYVDLLPHVNLVDNFHYARNMALPGARDDAYDVTFYITPPASTELSYHHDWRGEYGNALLKEQEFTFKNVDFLEIANATRR